MKLFLLLCVISYTVTVNAACKSNHDCQLNGVCNSGECTCDPAWTGPDCSSLNLKPAAIGRDGYHNISYSSWGGNIYDDGKGTYHMFVAEMTNHCGLTLWEHNSFINHVKSSSPVGPYEAVHPTFDVWTHNPTVQRYVDGTLLLWHVGGGKPAVSVSDPGTNCPGSNGTTPCGVHFNKDFPRKPLATESFEIAFAKSPEGPWENVIVKTTVNVSGNNPTGMVHPNGNGSVYMVFTDRTLLRADHWRGPFSPVPGATTKACGPGEDPFLFVDKRGAYHCVYHASPYKNPDIAIGHAFSADGLTWTVSPTPAATATITYEKYGNVPFGKRERPHIFQNAAGDITHFISGVCLNPLCTPWDRSYQPKKDCSPPTQYFECGCGGDRTWTLVQAVGT